MKNVSIFLNFEHINAPVAQWLYFLKRLSGAQPVFCNTFDNTEHKASNVNMLIEADTHEAFIKQQKPNIHFPENLQLSFNSKHLFPVFSLEEVLSSEGLLNELIDTDMIVICCKYFNEKGIKLDALTAKILNKAKCPVVFIPENINDNPESLDKIVFNTDIRFTGLKTVRTIARLCKDLKAGLTMAHVSNSGIPDIDETYGQSLFEHNFKTKVTDCLVNLENLKKPDIKKYPDMVHEFLKGDIYSTVNKNHYLKNGDYFCDAAIQFASIAQSPLLVINS